MLASLAAPDLNFLQPHLRFVDLPQETVLFEAGGTVSRIYFPHDGIVSLVVELTTGDMIEAAMIGREGVVRRIGRPRSPTSRSAGPSCRSPAPASAVEVDAVRRLAEQSSAFRAILIKHEQVLLAQSQQSAACNATHTLEARLCAGCCGAATCSPATRSRLRRNSWREMLGVRRTSVSVVANTLQQAGLIKYKRGNINVCSISTA